MALFSIPSIQPQNFYDQFLSRSKSQNELAKQRLENQYYGPNIESEIANRNALTQGYNINNQFAPERLRLANQNAALVNQYYAPNIQSEMGLRKAQADKINYLLQHPGLMGGEDAKLLQMIKDMGYNINNMQSNGAQNSAQQMPIEQNPMQSLPQQNNAVQTIPSTSQPSVFDESRPFNTNNPLINTVLNRRFAEAAYKNKMAQGYNWSHLPVSVKDQLVAQGYGMGVDPLKMADYINKGMSLSQIAKAEGLDPDNLPPPIYSPTTATKTRVQQVEQVGQELDYLSSSVTPIIKRYADTFAGISPERIKDMLNNDPEAQKRFGQYIGALSVQTGLANGRVLLEGGRAGLEVMRMVKNSSLQGIDQNSPIKMSKIAYEEAQKTIDNLLQKGAKIRTTTGMNPMSEIGRSKRKSDNGSSGKKATLRYNQQTGDFEEIK